MKPKTVLDDAAVKRIKAGISSALSPRHVPAVILDCPKIPVRPRLPRPPLFSSPALTGDSTVHDERQETRGRVQEARQWNPVGQHQYFRR